MDSLCYKEVARKLTNGLAEFIGKKKAIVGISGGVDSAVVAALCVKAVGKSNVVGAMMPYADQSIDDSVLLCKQLEITTHCVNVKPMVCEFLNAIGSSNKLVNGNLRARSRMAILYAFAGSLDGLVIGTGNKTELMLGYFTKYGDGGCDIEAIGNLYKTEVFELAKELDIPDIIVNKSPSAELWAGQTDEKEIGMTYREMDLILDSMDTNNGLYNRKRLVDLFGEEKVSNIENRIKCSEHKRRMPKVILVERD